MLKRSLKFFFFLFLVLVVIVIAVPLFFSQQVENAFIKRVNNYVRTDLKIKDEIELSLIRNFPYASLSLNNVELQESIVNSHRNLLEVQQLTFLFSWWDLFRGSYTVEQISIKNGNLNLRRFNDGTYNYNIFASNAESENEDVSLKLKQVLLKNITFSYLDEDYQMETEFTISNGTMSGNFGSLRYQMLLNSDIQVKHFYLYNTNYLPGKNAKIDLNIKTDFADNTFIFEKSSLQIEQNLFGLNGKIGFTNNMTDINLTINGQNLNLSECKELLSYSYLSKTKELKSNGILNLNVNIKGIYSKFEQPAVDIQFALENGTLTHPTLDGTLQNLRLTGNFTNGHLHQFSTSALFLENLSFTLKGKEVSASGKITDFEHPITQLKLDGAIELSAFSKMSKSYGLDKLTGLFTFNHVVLNGKIEDLKNATSLIYPELTGEALVSNMNFHVNGKEVQNFTLSAGLNGQHIQIKDSQLNFGNSDLKLIGNALNITPLIYQTLTQDTVTLTQPVNLQLKALSEQIDLTDLMIYFEQNKQETNQSPTSTESVFNKQHYVIGGVDVEIAKVIRDHLSIDNVKGILSIQNAAFNIQQINMQLLGGKAEIKGSFEIDDSNNVSIKIFLTATHLDLQKLMSQTGNFGQETFTENNIKGFLNSKAYLTIPLDKKLRVNQQAFKLIADVSIENGELLNFEPMMALSKYVKLSELAHVKFGKLENQVEIINRKLRIPSMYIHSNAVKLNFSGIHTFDDRLLYYIQLNLSDLLTNKFRKENKNIESEVNPKGGINLYLTMSGTSDKTEVRYMKKNQVKNRFDKDKNQPKTDLQKILEQEFSFESGVSSDLMEINILTWQDTTILNLK